ncbi:MAG: protein translocase subunit SecD [Bacillota bacterium]
MAKKSAIKLTLYIIVVAFLGFIAVNGLSLGVNSIKPVKDVIKRGLDLTGGIYTVYQAKDTSVKDFEYKMDSAVTVLRTRLDGKGFTEATITRQGTDKIRIEIPINETSENQDVNAISKYIGTPAVVQFLDPDGNVIMEGKNIKTARAALQTTQNQTQQYVVDFTLDDAGTKAFADATTELAGTGKSISITLDGKVISSPTVNQAITGGNGYIEGNFSKESAQELAMQIESGSLPIELNEIEVRSINATLGADALDTSAMAGLIGVGIVITFMIAFYRLPGVAASLALIGYILIMLFLLALLSIQLTLPGIAGIILSIGMAVDANVIIFERFKEEARAGKSLTASLESGFKRALSAIVDSNITTLIAALVLMYFGTGPIKGFAYTLALGICISMFTAITITRFLLRSFIRLNVKKKSLYVARLKS